MTILKIDKKEYCAYQSTNGKVIREIVKHPEIKNALFVTPPEHLAALDLKKICDPDFVVYIVRVNNKVAGIGVFQRVQETASVDMGFLPEFRGKDAKILANMAILDYLNRTGVRALIGKILKSNKRSLIFAAWNKFNIISSDDTYYYVEREYDGRRRREFS